MAKGETEHPTKGKKLPTEWLAQDEVFVLMRACSRRAPTGIRNRALLAVLYRTGLRISEALDLKPKDLDPDNGVLRVMHGKGDIDRTVGMDPTAFAVVEKWLEVRKKLGVPRNKPVFCTLKGAQITTAYIRELLPRLARKARIDKRVHAHAFRATHAIELMREGQPLHVIQAQLGHKSIATTAQYLHRLAGLNEQVVAMRGRDWTPPK